MSQASSVFYLVSVLELPYLDSQCSSHKLTYPNDLLQLNSLGEFYKYINELTRARKEQ